MSLPFGLMDSFSDFEELPPMPPVATVGDCGTLSLFGAGGDSGTGGRHSQVGGSNTRPVPKSGWPLKELLGEDRDGSEVLC